MKNMWLYSENNFFVFRSIIEQVADHVMVTDRNGVIEYVNPAFEKTTGYSKQEVVGKNPKILQSGKQPLEYYQNLWRTILAGNVFYSRTINKKKNGELYVADQTVSPIINEFKEIRHFVSIWKDITGTVRIEERLKFEKEKLEEIISFDEQLSKIRKSEHLIDFVVTKARKILRVEKCSVMLVDEETKQLYAKSMEGFAQNVPARFDISGSIAENVISEGKSMLVQNLEKDARFKNLKQASYLGNSFMIAPIRLGQDVIGVINVTDKRDDPQEAGIFDNIDLKILNAIATEMAIAIENVSYYKELHYLTITDPLTHMHNYRHYTNSLDYELIRLNRFPGDLCLMMIDIDGFKSFNDEFGHLEGDAFLKEISLIFHLNLRKVDILCRYGGDEFVVILPGTNKEGAMLVAENIRKQVGNAKFERSMTVSIGIAAYRTNMTRHDLTSKADEALYQAKEKGRNRVCVFGQD